MGLAKKAEVPVAEAAGQIAVTEVVADSGTNAAIARLKALPPIMQKEEGKYGKVQYKQRDFDAEARGKTRCVQFEAALMSPAIAGMQFNTMEDYLKLVKQAADAGVAYTFQD